MAPLDPKTMSFVNHFKPEIESMAIIADKGRTVIAAFTGTFAGRKLFNIRELYEEYGEWKPGKGISVPFEKRGELLHNLVKYAQEQDVIA